MRMRPLLVVSFLLSTACTARSGGVGSPPPDDAATSDAPPTDDTPSAMDAPSPDAPSTVDSPPPADNPPPPDSPPPVDACSPQAESSMAACHDGRDNDCDGFFDCADPGCASVCAADAGRDACLATGVESTNASCSDGIDNDCDGFIDCGGATGTSPDFGCTMTPGVTVCPRDGGAPVDTGCVPRGPENTNAACSNRVDDDCDGFIDCGGASGTSPDFDCTLSPAVTVCPRDGGTPPADTAGCIPTGRETGLAACSDGRDNDCNGYADCMERGCSCTGACGPSRMGCTCRGPETTNLACTNGVDDDCDGFIDCGGATGTSPDFDCTMTPAVTVCPHDAGP